MAVAVGRVQGDGREARGETRPTETVAKMGEECFGRGGGGGDEAVGSGVLMRLSEVSVC